MGPLYCVSQSLLKRGRGARNSPRMTSYCFGEKLAKKIPANIFTEANVSQLVKLVIDEMDRAAPLTMPAVECRRVGVGGREAAKAL